MKPKAVEMGGPGARLWELLMLFVSVNSALSLETVAVRRGQDVLLPCVQGVAPGRADLSVFWRGLDDAHLYDILDGRPDASSQDERFRGRVDSFPERYAQGNFSLRLRGAETSDAGRYSCHVPSLGLRQDVELSVTDPVVGAPQNRPDDSPGGRADTLPFHPALPLLLSASVLLLGMN